jgi:hypothetical protein
MLPQKHGVWQSIGQLEVVSPQAGSQKKSPHWQLLQSCGQLWAVSPHCGWHCMLPHWHGCAQS